jgi:hypothetical protein
MQRLEIQFSLCLANKNKDVIEKKSMQAQEAEAT